VRQFGTVAHPDLLGLVVLEDGRQRVEMLVGEDPVGPEEVALAGSGETCLHGRVHGDQLLDDRWAGSSELATKMIRESGGRRGLLIVRCLDARSQDRRGPPGFLGIRMWITLNRPSSDVRTMVLWSRPAEPNPRQGGHVMPRQ
jgi:hypothetical protein